MNLNGIKIFYGDETAKVTRDRQKMLSWKNRYRIKHNLICHCTLSSSDSWMHYMSYSRWLEPGQLSQYRVWLRMGRPGFDPCQRQRNLPLTSASRPALEPIQPPVQWVPGVKRGRSVMLTTHPLLVPRLRKSRSYTSSHPNAPLWSVTGPLYLYLTLADQVRPIFCFRIHNKFLAAKGCQSHARPNAARRSDSHVYQIK
jgi:hypothetical protein